MNYPTALSRFSRTPLWVLDDEFHAFLYPISLCLLGLSNEKKSITTG